jgi:subtilase family serine protease
VPDLSLVGDPDTGMLIVFNGRQEQDGGTSVSAPIMAAYTGLINDTRLAAGKKTLGMLNPLLYGLNQIKNLTDITTGDNGDMAGTGYDLVTGLGTPIVSTLLYSLANQN